MTPVGLGFKPRVTSLSTPNGRSVRAREVCGEHPGSPAEKGACNLGGRELTDKKRVNFQPTLAGDPKQLSLGGLTH